MKKILKPKSKKLRLLCKLPVPMFSNMAVYGNSKQALFQASVAQAFSRPEMYEELARNLASELYRMVGRHRGGFASRLLAAIKNDPDFNLRKLNEMMARRKLLQEKK